jgi:hypothetical protein
LALDVRQHWPLAGRMHRNLQWAIYVFVSLHTAAALGHHFMLKTMSYCGCCRNCRNAHWPTTNAAIVHPASELQLERQVIRARGRRLAAAQRC